MFLSRATLLQQGVDTTSAIGVVVAHSLLIIVIKKGCGMFGSIAEAPKTVLTELNTIPDFYSGDLAYGQMAVLHKSTGNLYIIGTPNTRRHSFSVDETI